MRLSAQSPGGQALLCGSERSNTQRGVTQLRKAGAGLHLLQNPASPWHPAPSSRASALPVLPVLPPLPSQQAPAPQPVTLAAANPALGKCVWCHPAVSWLPVLSPSAAVAWCPLKRWQAIFTQPRCQDGQMFLSSKGRLGSAGVGRRLQTSAPGLWPAQKALPRGQLRSLLPHLPGLPRGSGPAAVHKPGGDRSAGEETPAQRGHVSFLLLMAGTPPGGHAHREAPGLACFPGTAGPGSSRLLRGPLPLGTRGACAPYPGLSFPRRGPSVEESLPTQAPCPAPRPRLHSCQLLPKLCGREQFSTSLSLRDPFYKTPTAPPGQIGERPSHWAEDPASLRLPRTSPLGAALGGQNMTLHPHRPCHVLPLGEPLVLQPPRRAGLHVWARGPRPVSTGVA